MNLQRLNPLKRSLPKNWLQACMDNDYLAGVMGLAIYATLIS